LIGERGENGKKSDNVGECGDWCVFKGSSALGSQAVLKLEDRWWDDGLSDDVWFLHKGVADVE
jgi:hypothetical protein